MKSPKNERRRRRFTQEFKDDAVRMVILEGVPIREAAKKLGVERSCLNRWKNDYLDREDVRGQRAGLSMTPKEMDAELRSLRKQLRESELQREILKKALAIFSREESSGINS